MNATTSQVRKLKETTNHWGFVEDLYLAGDDDGIALRLLHGFDYEPESRKLWKKLCKDAPLVIDVGAHTGIYTLDAFKSGAKEVLSIEPYHVNFGRLVLNVRHAGFSSDACVFCAASDENTIINLGIVTPGYYCSAGCSLDLGNPSITFPVNTRKLDSLLKPEFHSKVKAVKIDTEYHGVKVLKGMSQILSYKPDLILECIEDGMTEILKPLGYKFFKIDEEKGLIEVEDLTPDNPFSYNSPNRFATYHGLR